MSPQIINQTPVTKPTLVYSEAPSAQDTASKLQDITLYSEPVFDSYNWTQDRRLPIEIYAVIDTRIAHLEKLLLKDRTKLNRELTDLLALITSELAQSNKTARERVILRYVENELRILQALYSKPRIL